MRITSDSITTVLIKIVHLMWCSFMKGYKYVRDKKLM